MQRITATLVIAATGALAQGAYINDGRSAWSLSYGLAWAENVSAHAPGLAYSAKGLFDFGFSYAFMDYDENPLGLGNSWGMNVALHSRMQSGDHPFIISLHAAYTHLDAGENDYNDPIWYEYRPDANTGSLGLGFHKSIRLGQATELHGETGFQHRFPEPDLGDTDGFGIDAFIPFEANLAVRLHQKAKLILGAWYSLYLLNLESSSKGIGISLMLFPP